LLITIKEKTNIAIAISLACCALQMELEAHSKNKLFHIAEATPDQLFPMYWVCQTMVIISFTEGKPFALLYHHTNPK